MDRFADLKCKDVVNISDGRSLGCICDLVVDRCTGMICAIVVPGCGRFRSLFWGWDEIVIPWCNIIKIGTDVILVEVGFSRVRK